MQGVLASVAQLGQLCAQAPAAHGAFNNQVPSHPPAAQLSPSNLVKCSLAAMPAALRCPFLSAVAASCLIAPQLLSRHCVVECRPVLCAMELQHTASHTPPTWHLAPCTVLVTATRQVGTAANKNAMLPLSAQCKGWGSCLPRGTIMPVTYWSRPRWLIMPAVSDRSPPMLALQGHMPATLACRRRQWTPSLKRERPQQAAGGWTRWR
jgi:hypothetical protein